MWMKLKAEDTDEARARIENIDELISEDGSLSGSQGRMRRT